MSIQEKILSALSENPDKNCRKVAKQEWNLDNALSILCEVFPNFINEIKGKDVLDFGCGNGYQAVCMAKKGAKFVLGVDISQKNLARAKQLAETEGVSNIVKFTEKIESHLKNKFDIVISQNSFEHFDNPTYIFNQMKSALKPKGSLYITFGPPWLAPYGSHTFHFTKVPWVNILFNEKTVMNVRKRFRDDGAKKYEEVEGGLNKMTINKFEHIIANSAMTTIYKKYDCIKKFDFIGRVPILREPFINRVNCIIKKNKP